MDTLYKHLRRRGRRHKKRGALTNGRGFIKNRVDIDKRPTLVDKKVRFGDLEIDTVIGKNHKGALLTSRPLKSPFLRDIVQVQYLAYFLKHAQKSFHSSFEVICCCREKYVHSISYHTLIKVAAQTIIRL